MGAVGLPSCHFLACSWCALGSQPGGFPGIPPGAQAPRWPYPGEGHLCGPSVWLRRPARDRGHDSDSQSLRTAARRLPLGSSWSGARPGGPGAPGPRASCLRPRGEAVLSEPQGGGHAVDSQDPRFPCRPLVSWRAQRCWRPSLVGSRLSPCPPPSLAGSRVLLMAGGPGSTWRGWWGAPAGARGDHAQGGNAGGACGAPTPGEGRGTS